MADIRTTFVLDDTDARTPESPLSYGGRWAAYGPWGDGLSLFAIGSHNLITTTKQDPGGSAQDHYYWTPTTFDGNVEVWARVGQQLEDGASSSLGLVSAAGGYGASWDGYHCRFINTFAYARWELYRIDNGSATNLVNDTGGCDVNDYMLFRRNGNDIEGWKSTDGGLNWSLEISYTDTTYTGAMSVSVGHSIINISTYPGFYHVGGGVNTNRPQIYRWIKN